MLSTRRSARRRCAAAALLAVAAGLCLAPAPAAAESEFERTLLRLANRALEDGDLATASQRFERVVSANPGSAPGLLGLGRVALARGDDAAAEARFEAALAIDPERPGVYLGLADVAAKRGDDAAARARLRAGLQQAPLDPRLHQRLFDLTGLAPTGARAGPDYAEALAEAHPYDPRAQLARARALVAEGRAEEARYALETALLVADLVPTVAPTAAELLAELSGEERRFVGVHVFADESVRAEPGWRFELRIALGRVAQALGPVLRTTFVPVAIAPFESERVTADLGSIHGAMLAAIDRPPLEGILAGFTRRESPRTATANRLGQAVYLGRELVARIDPKDHQGRTLAHEIVHLYGGIHLSDEIPSLMNPSGGAWSLDRYNTRIVEITRTRRFGPAGLDRNVLSRVDEHELAEALLAALRVNVNLRNAGLAEALEQARTSRVVASQQARAAMSEDRHLGEVAQLTAIILQRADRAAEAVLLMESAARLYGPRTAPGRAAQAQADRWRAAYKAFLSP